MSGLAEATHRQPYPRRRNRDQGTAVLPLSNVLSLVHLGRFSHRDSRRSVRLLDQRGEQTETGRRETLRAYDTEILKRRESTYETTGEHGDGEREREQRLSFYSRPRLIDSRW